MNVTKFFLLAAATLSLAACSNDETIDNSPVEARFTAGIGAPVTRAVGSNWNVDHIGITVTNATSSDMAVMYRNVEYSTTSTGATADFAPVREGIFFQDKGETVTFSAYAPYQESISAHLLPGEEGVISVNTQDSNGDAQESIDFLFASGATASQQNPIVIFTDNISKGGSDNSFHHQMAQLNIVLKTSAADGFMPSDIFVESNTFNLGGLVHDGTFNVTTGEAAATGEAVNTWDITGCKKVDDQSDKTRTYSLILLPQDLRERPLNLGITIDDQLYTNKDKINPNLEAGMSYTYTITVRRTDLDVSGCTIANWGNGGSDNGTAEMQ